MSESSSYAGATPDAAPESYNAYAAAETAAGRQAFDYNSPQYSAMLAEQRQAADDAWRRTPAGQAWQNEQERKTLARESRKGTFNIIAGIFAAVAVVLTGGTLLGVFGPAAAALEGGAAAAGAAAGGLEGAVAAGVAEGAIEAGVATAAVAEAAPAVAAVETGVSAAAAGGAEAAAAGGAAGAAEAAAPSVFSSIIDGATSVYNAVSGAIETVGELTNISGAISNALVPEASPLLETPFGTITDKGLVQALAKTAVGAGRGAVTSGLTGGDPGLGALGGAVGGLVGDVSKTGLTNLLTGDNSLFGDSSLGKLAVNTLSGSLASGASGGAKAAVSGSDVGDAILRGLATGGAGGFASTLVGDTLGLGNTVGSIGGSIASTLVGNALAPDAPTPSSQTVTQRTPQTVVVRVPYPTSNTAKPVTSTAPLTNTPVTSTAPLRATPTQPITSAPTNAATGGVLSSTGLGALLSSSGGSGNFDQGGSSNANFANNTYGGYSDAAPSGGSSSSGGIDRNFGGFTGSDNFSNNGNLSPTGSGSGSIAGSAPSSQNLTSTGMSALNNFLNAGSGVGGTDSYGGGIYGTTSATSRPSTPSAVSTSTLASLLSSPGDPGYSSPLGGNADTSQYTSNLEPGTSQQSPWNRSSLRQTDPLGSYYG